MLKILLVSLTKIFYGKLTNTINGKEIQLAVYLSRTELPANNQNCFLRNVPQMNILITTLETVKVKCSMSFFPLTPF